MTAARAGSTIEGMDKKRLARSTTDKKIGGVAGGIAEYLDIDPTLVRVIFVFMLLPGGVSALPYFILWIVLPEDDGTTTRSSPAVQIAEERFARGEIDADDLHRIRADLESG